MSGQEVRVSDILLGLYKATAQLGLAPSEFWMMSPKEISIWFNSNRPTKYYGGMNEDQAKSITDRMNENPDRYS